MAAHQGGGSTCVPGKHLPGASTGAVGGAYECLDWYDTHDYALLCVLSMHNYVRIHFNCNCAFWSPHSIKEIIQNKVIQRLIGKICGLGMD